MHPPLASPATWQYLHLDGNSYELKWPFVTTQLLHTAAPWCKKVPYGCYTSAPCSPLVSSPIHLNKSAGWKCQGAARFPCGVLPSVCDPCTAVPADLPQHIGGGDSARRFRHLNVSISAWPGCLIQLLTCDVWHERCCRLSIGPPCYKGANLPWPASPGQASQMPLDISNATRQLSLRNGVKST